MLATTKAPRSKVSTKTSGGRTKEKETIEVDLSGEWPMVGRYDWEGLGPAGRGRPWEWGEGSYLTFDKWDALTFEQRTALAEFLRAKGREIRETSYHEDRGRGPCRVHFPIHQPVSVRGTEIQGHYVTLNAPSCRNEMDIAIYITNSDSVEEAEFRVRQFLEDLMTCGLAERRPESDGN